MTHLTQPSPAARALLRATAVLGVAGALTAGVLVATANLVGAWT